MGEEYQSGCLGQWLLSWAKCPTMFGTIGLGGGEEQEKEEEEKEAAVNSTRCVSAHFPPLMGEMDGRTGQRRDSSRAAGPEGLRFGDMEL